MKDERGDITADIIVIQRIIRDNSKQVYANRLET
jgi:hypothetical protein